MEIEVVQDEECIELMRDFIREKPELWHEDIAV
jgi:cytosine deaminase